MSSTFLSGGIKESSPFPDGQPHICVDRAKINKDIICRISSPKDLFNVCLLADVIDPGEHRMRIAYLMGGRMDRALSSSEPYTLRSVCRVLNGHGWKSVSVFCAHSSSTHDLLNRYEDWFPLHEDTFYDYSIVRMLSIFDGNQGTLSSDEKYFQRSRRDISIVFPDLGAQKRFAKSQLKPWYPYCEFVTMMKDRCERTGVVHGTKVVSGSVNANCVIVDDLCDGGATFVSAAKELRAKGAYKIGLAVCHGVLSKGHVLDGIDCVSTTNSFCDRVGVAGSLLVTNISGD